MRKLAMLLVVLSMLSCEEPELLTSVETIKYGTSFGMCVGYCLTETTVSSQNVNMISSGWNNSVTPKQLNAPFSQAELDQLLKKIDAEVYLSLNPVIGCPDCADGGAEWIELSLDGRVKRVTFQYGAEIEGIKEAVTELRTITMKLKEQ